MVVGLRIGTYTTDFMGIYPFTKANKSSPWVDIQSHYIDFVEGKEMQELIKHIIDSGASKRLFAYTSHYDLVVGIYEEIHPFNEALHIGYDLSKKGTTWIFEYYATQSIDPQFKRRYSEGMLIEKFDSFLDRIRW